MRNNEEIGFADAIYVVITFLLACMAFGFAWQKAKTSLDFSVLAAVLLLGFNKGDWK